MLDGAGRGVCYGPTRLLEGLSEIIRGLVPGRAFRATSASERVSLHRINKKTGHRLRQQLIDEESGELVDSEDVSRGYETGQHRYVEIEDEELARIQAWSTHTIDRHLSHELWLGDFGLVE